MQNRSGRMDSVGEERRGEDNFSARLIPTHRQLADRSDD